MVTKLGALQFQIGGTTKWQRCKHTAVSLVWGLTFCCPAKTCLLTCSPTMIQLLHLPLELLLVWCLVSWLWHWGGEGVVGLTLPTTLQNSLSPSRDPEHAFGVTRSLHALARETVPLESKVDLIGCRDRWDEGLSLSDTLHYGQSLQKWWWLSSVFGELLHPCGETSKELGIGDGGERELSLLMILGGAVIVWYQCCERSKPYHPWP